MLELMRAAQGEPNMWMVKRAPQFYLKIDHNDPILTNLFHA